MEGYVRCCDCGEEVHLDGAEVYSVEGIAGEEVAYICDVCKYLNWLIFKKGAGI